MNPLGSRNDASSLLHLTGGAFRVQGRASRDLKQVTSSSPVDVRPSIGGSHRDESQRQDDVPTDSERFGGDTVHSRSLQENHELANPVRKWCAWAMKPQSTPVQLLREGVSLKAISDALGHRTVGAPASICGSPPRICATSGVFGETNPPCSNSMRFTPPFQPSVASVVHVQSCQRSRSTVQFTVCRRYAARFVSRSKRSLAAPRSWTIHSRALW